MNDFSAIQPAIQIAEWCLQCMEVREASYNLPEGAQWGEYTKSYRDAVHEVVNVREFRPLVQGFLYGFSADAQIWAVNILLTYKPNSQFLKPEHQSLRQDITQW